MSNNVEITDKIWDFIYCMYRERQTTEKGLFMFSFVLHALYN